MSSHEGNDNTAETERIELLRKILEGEQHRKIAYEEAFEVARLRGGSSALAPGCDKPRHV